jgi:hypothetical protein
MRLSLTSLYNYAECHYGEVRNLFVVMLSVIMPSVIMLNVTILLVVMLSVVAPVNEPQGHFLFAQAGDRTWDPFVFLLISLTLPLSL